LAQGFVTLSWLVTRVASQRQRVFAKLKNEHGKFGPLNLRVEE
jgi:hypothetical protein